MMRSLPIALAALLVTAGSPPDAPIEVAVSGIASDKGLVHVDICSAIEFLKPGCRRSGEARAVPGTTIVTIADVPPGEYAAQGFHDRNGNHRPDRDLLGLPTERIGFSNNVRVHLAPPKWADAMFVHGRDRQRIAFAVRSLP